MGSLRRLCSVPLSWLSTRGHLVALLPRASEGVAFRAPTGVSLGFFRPLSGLLVLPVCSA